MSAALAAYEAIAKDATLDPVNDSDLPRLLPLLDQARALPFGDDAGRRGGILCELRPVADRQARAPARATVYRHALEHACCRG